MPPKKLNKKQLRKKQEEERLRQEELARQEQERIRILEEEERLRKEEIARVKAEEDKKRGEQEAEIADYIQRIFSLSSHKCARDWERKRWNDYLYRTKEMDALKLPIVNAFITEWMDDSSYEVESIVRTSHRCLEIVDEITSALYTCPEAYAKTSLWKEGIVNLKKAIERKLDYASFMLLKDAYLYLDEKTRNMEYGFSEDQITLCLWANIHKAVRRHGMERKGFRFWIPPDLASEDCAVRILHLSFPPAPSLEKEDEEDATLEEHLKSNELISEKVDTMLKANPAEEILNVKNEDSHSSSIEVEREKVIDNCIEMEKVEKQKSKPMEQMTGANISPVVTNASPAEEQDSANTERGVELTLDIIDTIPPEPQKKFLDLNEYFLVGGLLHFDFLEVPKLTLQVKGLTYIHREEPYLKRKKCEPKPFQPVFSLPEAASSAKLVEAEKTEETQQEETTDSDSEAGSQVTVETIKQNIGLRMTLPANIVFMDVPQPALFNADENSFSTECITVEDYNEEERIIMLETEQFGIFGLFQKLYSNFPYKSWQLNGGNTVKLCLVGKFLTLKIAISDKGCRVESMKPGNKVVTELMDSLVPIGWMTPEQLIEKLLSFGVNIAYGKKASEFIGISQKMSKLEDAVYDSIALLSKNCDFSGSKWNRTLSSGDIALNYRHLSARSKQEKDKYNLALIRKDRTIKLKQGEENETFSNEPADSQFSGTLYHLVQIGKSKTLEEIASESGWTQNVRLLLQKCRILSCA